MSCQNLFFTCFLCNWSQRTYLEQKTENPSWWMSWGNVRNLFFQNNMFRAIDWYHFWPCLNFFCDFAIFEFLNLSMSFWRPNFLKLICDTQNWIGFQKNNMRSRSENIDFFNERLSQTVPLKNYHFYHKCKWLVKGF